MLEKYLATINITKENILKMSDENNLSYKEMEALKKGKEFIDKQMELPNEEIRNKIGVLLLAYIIEKYDKSNN